MFAKICGIRTVEEAACALQHGAWALGFNFYPHSSRYISEAQAISVIRTLPKKVLKVGIIAPNMYREAIRFKERLGLDVLQVYEDLEVDSSAKKEMILGLCVNSIDELPSEEILQQYGYVLLDAPRRPTELVGGTGRLSHWAIAQYLSTIYRFILAGGLTPHNVRQAIETVNPFAVDVASGVEHQGKKSSALIKQFLNEVHDVT